MPENNLQWESVAVLLPLHRHSNNGIPDLPPAEAHALPLLALPADIAAHRIGRSKSRFKQLARSIADKLGAADTKSAIVIAARAGVQFEFLAKRSRGGGSR